MSVNHGGADVAVAQEFLDGTDVIAVLQHVRRKGMPKDVAAGALVDTGLGYGFFHRLLQKAFAHVVAALLSCHRIFPSVRLGEQPLPLELFSDVGRPVGHICGDLRVPPTFRKILFMQRLNISELIFYFGTKAMRKHHAPVFGAALAFALVLFFVHLAQGEHPR